MKKGALLFFLVFVFLVLNVPSNYAAMNMFVTPTSAPIDAELTFTFAITSSVAETFAAGSAAFFVDYLTFNDMDYNNMSITAKAGVTIAGWETDGRSVTVTGINAAEKTAFFDLTMFFTMPSEPGVYTAFTGKYNFTGATPNIAFDSEGIISVLDYTPTSTVTATITVTATQTVTQTITQVVNVLGSNLETRNLLTGGSGLELVSATGVELAGILITSTDCTSATLTAYTAASIGTTTTANYRFQLPAHDCGNLPKFIPFTVPWMVGITPKQWYYDFPGGMVISRDGGTMEAVIFYRRK